MKPRIYRPDYPRLLSIARDDAFVAELGKEMVAFALVENGSTFLGRVEYVVSQIVDARVIAMLKRVRTNGQRVAVGA